MTVEVRLEVSNVALVDSCVWMKTSALSEMNLEVQCRPEGFWSAVDVWIKKPHVVNKRLCGATEAEYRDVSSEELALCLCSLTGISLPDFPEILPFLHAHAAAAGHQTVPSWSVGGRTVIPKRGPQSSGAKLYKEVVVKGKIPLGMRKGFVFIISLYDFVALRHTSVIFNPPDLSGQTVTFLPVEEDSEGHTILRRSNVYQIQLQPKTDDW